MDLPFRQKVLVKHLHSKIVRARDLPQIRHQYLRSPQGGGGDGETGGPPPAVTRRPGSARLVPRAWFRAPAAASGDSDSLTPSGPPRCRWEQRDRRPAPAASRRLQPPPNSGLPPCMTSSDPARQEIGPPHSHWSGIRPTSPNTPPPTSAPHHPQNLKVGCGSRLWTCCGRAAAPVLSPDQAPGHASP